MRAFTFALVLFAFAALVFAQDSVKSQPATAEVNDLVNSLKSEIEGRAGNTYSQFNSVEFAAWNEDSQVQLVAKIQVGSNQFIGARINLGSNSNSVASVKTGLSSSDAIYPPTF